MNYLFSFRRLLLTLSLLYSSVALSQADPFPQASTYRRTLSFALLDASDDFHFERKTFTLLPERAKNKYFKKQDKKVNFAWVKASNPVSRSAIIYIPGTGSPHSGGSTKYLMELMANSGHHVLSFDNPTHWRFAISVSPGGVSGDFDYDVENLSRAVELGLDKLRQDEGVEIDELHFAGVSLGGVYASILCDKLVSGAPDVFLSDYQVGKFLLLNPALDIQHAFNKIDLLLHEREDLGDKRRQEFFARLFDLIIAISDSDLPSDQLLSRLINLPVDDKFDKYAIAENFQLSTSDLAYASSILTKAKMKTKLSWGLRKPRQDEVAFYSLQDYFDKFIVNKGRRIKQLAKYNHLQSSLTPACRPRTHVIHNRDDFIVTDSDIRLLEANFAERATVLPQGGHLGNLWYPQVRELISRYF